MQSSMLIVSDYLEFPDGLWRYQSIPSSCCTDRKTGTTTKMKICGSCSHPLDSLRLVRSRWQILDHWGQRSGHYRNVPTIWPTWLPMAIQQAEPGIWGMSALIWSKCDQVASSLRSTGQKPGKVSINGKEIEVSGSVTALLLKKVPVWPPIAFAEEAMQIIWNAWLIASLGSIPAVTPSLKFKQ